MPLQLKTFTPALSEAETTLLCRAFAEWNLPDDAFSDAEVAEVKALFARVFGTADAARLEGHPIADALLLYERCDRYYAAVQEDQAWVWKRVDVACDPTGERVLDQSITFDQLLLFLAN